MSLVPAGSVVGSAILAEIDNMNSWNLKSSTTERVAVALLATLLMAASGVPSVAAAERADRSVTDATPGRESAKLAAVRVEVRRLLSATTTTPDGLVEQGAHDLGAPARISKAPAIPRLASGDPTAGHAYGSSPWWDELGGFLLNLSDSRERRRNRSWRVREQAMRNARLPVLAAEAWKESRSERASLAPQPLGSEWPTQGSSR